MTHVIIGIISNVIYENLKKSETPIFAKSVAIFFPFQHLSDEQIITFEKGIDRVSDGALHSLPDNRMKSFFKNLNNLNTHHQEDDDDDYIHNNINCKFYLIDELKQEIVRNIASLGAHKDEFEDMLSILDLDFDILGRTETRIIKE